ncbi:hypothetical protein F4810DRAFT_668582 [Camillea tinctor]|nr:hypothetical protein F4810DRAFT_668582 [Camillea tinctor]
MAAGLVLLLLVGNAFEKLITWPIQMTIGIAALWSVATAVMYAFQCPPSQEVGATGQVTCLPSTVLAQARIALSAWTIVVGWGYGVS